MRKLIVVNMMSLDGYYEGPLKNVMDLFSYRAAEYPADDSFDQYNLERLRSADTLLLGHKSYAGFMGYWPSVADESAADPIAKETSRRMNAIEKIVVSDGLSISKTDPWQNTRILRSAEAQREIAALKKSAGSDILIFGSHVLWNDLLAKGLVDELHVMIAPVLLGGGTPLIPKKPGISLRLMDARTREGAGTVLLRYTAG